MAAQAVELAERCPDLAAQDEQAWLAALEALDALGDALAGGSSDRDGDLRDRLVDSVELPVTIAETGADVAALAALAARRGEGMFRSDAVSAALLAHAGVRVARHLVDVNLGTRAEDERSRLAAACEWRAGQAVGEALAASEP